MILYIPLFLMSERGLLKRRTDTSAWGSTEDNSRLTTTSSTLALPSHRVGYFSTMLRWSSLSHLRCRPSTIGRGVFIGDFRPISTIHPSLPHPVVELPHTPRYPCPFISEADIKTYLLPLYSSGWGVSAQHSNNKLAPSATQLSKRIPLPSSDIARLLRQDVDSHVIKLENHHPVWEESASPGVCVTIHVHTHSAIAPDGRCNVHDVEDSPNRKRPGITYRDIRFALLLDSLFQDYAYHRLFKLEPMLMFPQPMTIDSVHHFRPIANPIS